MAPGFPLKSSAPTDPVVRPLPPQSPLRSAEAPALRHTMSSCCGTVLSSLAARSRSRQCRSSQRDPRVDSRTDQIRRQIDDYDEEREDHQTCLHQCIITCGDAPDQKLPETGAGKDQL